MLIGDDGIESAVRRVVARQLRVPSWLLAPSVSLRDDLASDREGIHDLVLAVECGLGVRLEAQALDEVRSYGELVTATIEAIRVRRAALERESEASLVGRVRIVNGDAPGVARAGPLTPYLLEAVCEDARRAGPGSTVTVGVGADATDAQIAGIRDRLGRLDRLGVAVHVARAVGVRGPHRLVSGGSTGE